MSDIVKALKSDMIRNLDLGSIHEKMLEQDQIEIPVHHIFSGGVYIRQIRIPAGTFVMGKRHRFETCNILMSGKLIVYSENDVPPLEIEGPIQFTTPPLTRKFAYCVEDAVFMNILPTSITDVDKIEEQFIMPDSEYKSVIGSEEVEKCHS